MDNIDKIIITLTDGSTYFFDKNIASVVIIKKEEIVPTEKPKKNIRNEIEERSVKRRKLV